MSTSKGELARLRAEKSQARTKNELSPKTAIAAIAGVVLILGAGTFLLTGKSAPKGEEQPQQSATQMDSDAKWWEAAARRSDGDFNRLSVQDQEHGESLAGDRAKAANTLYGVYRSQARAQGRVPNAPAALQTRNLSCEELKKQHPAEYVAAWRLGTCK